MRSGCTWPGRDSVTINPVVLIDSSNITNYPNITIVRRSEQMDLADDRRRRRSVESGAWCRIAAGSYARTSEWSALKPIQKHRVRVTEAARRMRPGAVISHLAAAACHDIDVLGTWPDAVDVIVKHASGGRSSGGIRRHATGLSGVHTEPFGEHQVTTPAQTELDLARSLPFVSAVTAVDQAIWKGATRWPLDNSRRDRRAPGCPATDAWRRESAPRDGIRQPPVVECP
jgi:hypothetical protein